MEWISVKDRLPDLGDRVLVAEKYASVDQPDYPFIARRIAKQHVPVEVLKKRREDYDGSEELGWKPGACYQWEEMDHIDGICDSYYFPSDMEELHKFLMDEIEYWMPLPDLPNDIPQP